MSKLNDLEVLARTVWGEARGEGPKGMFAVACVVRNRVEMDLNNDGRPDWWGEGYYGVCTKKYQFSCWNKNDPNYRYMVGLEPIPPAQLAEAREAARRVLSGEADVTGGATHYYSTTMKVPPNWVSGATRTTKIGRHIFYRGVK